jgi:hypothetical protein
VISVVIGSEISRDQVPQPPGRHQARFKADWDGVVEDLD